MKPGQLHSCLRNLQEIYTFLGLAKETDEHWQENFVCKQAKIKSM